MFLFGYKAKLRSHSAPAPEVSINVEIGLRSHMGISSENEDKEILVNHCIHT